VKLKVSDKHKTKYCVPEWVRDEQIKRSIKRVSGRIQPGGRKRGSVAIVGFGPSLNTTWKKLKKFKVIFSCSGSHKFLVDRGIIPTYHVEVDPREHKVSLIGKPQKETEYLIASTCHPKVFDHLEGFNVKLWHVFDSTEEGRRLLPHGEWAVTGGCDVGMRAMTLAAFLGYRNLHCFGIDGSAKGAKHAADHPLGVKEGFSECEYPEGSGKIYHTTTGMLEAAKQIWHELDQMPAVRAKFYGKGLVQAMAKDYKFKGGEPDKPYENIIAFNKPELISEAYRDMNAKLHHENLAYGVGGARHAKAVVELCRTLKTTSVLDYGCGKGYLAKQLPYPIWEYDPAVPGKQETPRSADIVVSTDVLEHIEPERLAFVLDDIRRCMRKVGYFTIHTGPAQKTLPDGRNTHLIQQGAEWWEKTLSEFFTVGKITVAGNELHVVVGAKKKPAPPTPEAIALEAQRLAA